MLRVLLLFLLPVIGLAAVPTGALNRLYEHQAILAEAVDSLGRLEEPAPCTLPDRPRVVLERKAGLKPAGGGRKLKLAAGSTLVPVSRRGDALVVIHNGDSLAVDCGSNPAARWAGLLLDWRRDSLECRVTADRGLHGLRMQRTLAERDLAKSRELETLYRRPGTHLKVEPDRMIEGSVLPAWGDSLLCLDWLRPDSLACAAEPWGRTTLQAPAADGLPAVLRFAGVADGWITFHRLDTGDSLYCHTEEVARRFPRNQADELLGWAALDMSRTRAARRFELLKRWEPELADRLLDGLVWKGMTREMLDEALGRPSSETVTEKTVVREYTRGSRVTLLDGRVTAVEQAPRP